MDEAEGDESKNVNTTEAGDDMLINVTDVLNENLGNEESKPRKIQGYRQLNYRSQILDEICLEGLDGITLQALWLRLQERYDFTLGVEENCQKFIWKLIVALKDVKLYKLTKPRPDLIIHDRYKYIDGELGIVVEPNLMPPDIYPFSLADEEGVKGSCLSFSTRILLDKKLSYEEAKGLGNRLVLVGSQKARYKSVLGTQYCPLQAMNITAMQWALLERIGRARYQGEITQGNLSLQFTNENPKTLFYHRKSLVAKGMLTKQVHHQKTVKQLKNSKIRSQNSQGTLFHLPRFYVERQPKALIHVKRMIGYLKKFPSCMATYEDLKAYLNIGGAFKKLLKTHDFLKYMQGDVKVPYRSIHPDASSTEWKRKGLTDEKMLRVVKLINPETTPEDVFNNSADNVDPSQVTEQTDQQRPLGVQDQSNWKVDRSVMWQAYHVVEESGPDGISQQDLGRKLGHGKLEARTICRNLIRRKLVITVLDDRGRQRVTNFVAKKFETESGFSSRFQEEKARNEALTIRKRDISDLDITDTTMVTSTPLTIRSIKRRKIEDNSSMTTADNLEDNADNTTVIEADQSTLHCNNSAKETKILQLSPMKTPENNTDFEGPRTRKKSAELKQKSASKVVPNDDAEDSVTEQFKEEVEDKSRIPTLENDGQFLMSISSDFQLNDKCKSPLKKRDKRMENQSSLRQLQRVNTIIEAVRHYKVIDDPTKLFKMIQLNELKEGYNAKMDKKSLLRILAKLQRDGQIKNITVNLQLGDKDKNLHFVCEPHIDESNTVIQSAIEQAKMKFNSYRLSPDPDLRELIQKKIDAGEFVKEDTPCSGTSTPPLQIESGSSTPKGKINKRYGLQPKFVRMRELHLLLFYLSKDYTGDTDLDQFQALKSLQDRDQLSQEDIRELSKCQMYMSNPDWRMFIPPLPKHSDWKENWCLMCDVLLRLPLSMFVKLVHITFEVPGLQEYLEHPVKQHMLIRNLPSTIRKMIMHQRKYIFTIHEVATRLAYIGVIQFGPQKLKEKDQVFLYVNMNTTLMDTTSSISGYHQIETGRNYPVKNYYFTSMAQVERYWYDMWEICISTPLGESSGLSGQEITVELMDRKLEMVAALEPRQVDEAPLQDDGHIPGDGLGAAGLDSSIFAHLKRNWSTNSSTKRPIGKSEHIQRPPFCIELLQDDEGIEPRRSKLPIISTEIKVTKEPNKAKERRKKVADEPKVAKIVIKEPAVRPNKITRVVGKRKTQVERKPYYDEKDKAALRLMRKLRVDWTAREDSFLLLCRAAGMFLRADTKNQMVQYTSVRDLLHKYFPESCNKTSRACQRRLNYMMKNQTTVDNVNLFLADLQQDETLLDRFNLALDPNESKADAELRLDTEFGELVHILITKKENASNATKLDLPDTIEAIKEKYTILNPGSSNHGTSSSTGVVTYSNNKNAFQEPTCIDDIHCAVINTLVVSSLCCASDKRSWTFQLFKIYQQYPDTLLRKAMADLRQNKMVSLKKHYSKNNLKQGNYLPLSSSPYQLSVTFAHSFLNRYQYDIYSQSWKMMKLFLNNSNQFTEIQIGQEGGFAATVTALLAHNKLTFCTEVPEQLVVLDPTLSAVNENYIRILERYKELLRNAGGIDQADIDNMRMSPTKPLQSSGNQSMAEPGSSGSSKANKPTCTTLFSKAKHKKPESERSSEEIDTEKVPKETRITGEENLILFQEGSDARSNTALAKSASRIALYMMREEIHKSPLDSGDPVQHSHDFFVISSCKLQGKLKCPEKVKDEERIVNYSDIKVPMSWLPGDIQAYESLLKRFGVGLGGQNILGVNRVNSPEMSSYVPLKLDPVPEILNSIEDQLFRNKAEKILEIIDKEQNIGVTRDDLLKLDSISRKESISCLQFLVCNKLIIAVGIVDTRWVSHKYCRDWLIHTYKVSRTKFVEKQESLKFTGKLYHTGQETREEESKETEGLGPRIRRPPRRFSIESATGGEDIKVEMRKNQMATKISNDVSDAVKKINWDDMEEILVQIRPWVRIDGSLNRRVLDRLLGAVLGATMQLPGSRLDRLAARFSPALQPVHAKELIHMLAHIKAVQINKMTKAKKPGLWSKPDQVVLEVPDILDSDQEIIVEPSVDAILLLGQFIGNKVYTTDFVCQCPCHPDRRM